MRIERSERWLLEFLGSKEKSTSEISSFLKRNHYDTLEILDKLKGLNKIDNHKKGKYIYWFSKVNSIRRGNYFEKKAKEILQLKGYKILEESSKKKYDSHYDFIVEKAEEKVFIEVRGKKGKSFQVSETKTKYYKDIKDKILFLLINEEGYVFIDFKLFNNNNLIRKEGMTLSIRRIKKK